MEEQSAPQSHFDLFCKLYVQALRLAHAAPSSQQSEAKESSEEISAKVKTHNQKVLIMLDTLTKLIFGLDEKKKAQVVSHGGGTLELVMTLFKSASITETDSETDKIEMSKIQMSALKVIKTCAIRNPAGRRRARTAGVFDFIKDVLDTTVVKSELDSNSTVSLAEEAFTTLAALCLGDDLNALDASTIFKQFLSQAKTKFPNAQSMHQKIVYLDALFQAIEKEQDKLIRSVAKLGKGGKSGMQIFLQSTIDCEIETKTGHGHLQDKKFAISLKHYNYALSLISPYLEQTSLLDAIMVDIRIKRASTRFQLKNFTDCLEDTFFLLERKDTAEDSIRCELLSLHAKALMEVGREKEGQEALGKLHLIRPGGIENISQSLEKTLNVDDKESS